MSPVDEVTVAGEPVFWVSNIPPEIAEETSSGEFNLEIVEPRIYYGEATDGYIIANTRTEEFDFPLSGGDDAGAENAATTRYSGQGGIELGGFFRRLAFSWAFADTNILISAPSTATPASSSDASSRSASTNSPPSSSSTPTPTSSSAPTDASTGFRTLTPPPTATPTRNPTASASTTSATPSKL